MFHDPFTDIQDLEQCAWLFVWGMHFGVVERGQLFETNPDIGLVLRAPLHVPWPLGGIIYMAALLHRFSLPCSIDFLCLAQSIFLGFSRAF